MLRHIDPVTTEPFDPKASAEGIIQNAQDIQQLLKTYQKNTRILQDYVAFFVRREDEEEERFNEISVSVAHAEMSSLQNGEYIRYIHKHRGEVDVETVMPTSRMRLRMAANQSSDLRKLKWTSSDFCADWAPDESAALKGFGDVREVLLGWRPANSSNSESFCDLMKNLFTCDQKYVCFFNGIMFCPFYLRELIHINELTSRVHAIKMTSSDGAVNLAARVYLNYVYEMAALGKCEFLAHLWDSSRTPTLSSKWSVSAFTPHLLGDVFDNIVLVRPERLVDTHTFRGFFLNDCLAAVEHLGPYCDVLSDLCMASSHSCRDLSVQEKDRIVNTFQMLYDCYTGTDLIPGKNSVMTIAVQREPLTPSQTVAPHQHGVLLDLRPISPSLPFDWHFSWAEICALGQMGLPTSQDVVFKVTEIDVNSLQPYNDISEIFFESVNDAIRRPSDAVRDTVNAAASWAAATTAATAVAAGTLAFMWLMKNK